MKKPNVDNCDNLIDFILMVQIKNLNGCCNFIQTPKFSLSIDESGMHSNLDVNQASQALALLPMQPKLKCMI